MKNEEEYKKIVAKIESLDGKYDPSSDLSALEQLEICESLAESELETQPQIDKTTDRVNAYVNGNDNGTCKRCVNSELNDSKRQAIEELRSYTYKTPIFRIAESLEKLFQKWESNPSHWPYIAQYYSPRAINRTISAMTKQYSESWDMLQNPAAFFTTAIKFRKIRIKITRKIKTANHYSNRSL